MLEHGAMRDALRRIAEVEDVDSARTIAREVLETIPADPERPSP
jgi:hypothetical protein